LPHDLAPGDSVAVRPLVSAPSTPGTYTLELSLEQIDGTRFDVRGVTTPIAVHPAANP
jgi:hypothetical protein